MNPAEKRLAVMVDDHPLNYGTFEGIIPAGRYGAGPVVIWDTGTFTALDGADASEQWRRGAMKFVLSGKTLKGAFALVQMKGRAPTPNIAAGEHRKDVVWGRGSGKDWLLMKKSDEFADPTFSIASALTPAKRKQLKARVPPCETS
jgi:bifunctional non-homologous end joining protein LigD